MNQIDLEILKNCKTSTFNELEPGDRFLWLRGDNPEREKKKVDNDSYILLSLDDRKFHIYKHEETLEVIVL